MTEANHDSAESGASASGLDNVSRRPLREVFDVFLRAGLAFGGGLGILAVLEEELVTKRRVIERDEFLATYGIGRIVPSGTMTALAVAFGRRMAGVPGTIVALTALSLPALGSTIALTAAYDAVRSGPLLDLLPVTLLPAALALVMAAGWRLGQRYMHPSRELAIALGAFAGSVVVGLNPALLLIVGGAAAVAMSVVRPVAGEDSEPTA